LREERGERREERGIKLGICTHAKTENFLLTPHSSLKS